MAAFSGLIFDGAASCNGGIFNYGCNEAYQPSAEPWKQFSNNGYLAYTPTDASSPAAVIEELDLLLTAGRLDEASKMIITAEYQQALDRSACPVDKSAALCGRLTPGQTLNAGESITNADGETLCFSYDGVARHIDADGREVDSTATFSREASIQLGLSDECVLGPKQSNSWGKGCLWIGQEGGKKISWDSNALNRAGVSSFAAFLHGPCDSFSADQYERHTVFEIYDKTAYSHVVQCDAQSTCERGRVRVDRPLTEAYVAQRAKTDAEYAIRVAQNLIALSPAFAVTNQAGAKSNPAAAEQAPPISQRTPYKALVILFLRGGADTFNMLVPYAQCDSRNLRQQYLETRGVAAVSSVLPIDLPKGSQPCDQFGVHSQLPTLQRLFKEGDAAFFANMGNLIEPLNKTQYLKGLGKIPQQLFGHNYQENDANSLYPQANFADGISGRISVALSATMKTAGYSITNHKYSFRGAPTEPIVLHPTKGMVTYDGSGTAARADNLGERSRSLAAIDQMMSREVSSVYAATYNNLMRTSLADSERLAGLLASATVTQNWNRAMSTPKPALGQQLHQVSKVIASRTALQAERDIFLVEMSGFDTHANIHGALSDLFLSMDAALATFEKEMKAQGAWEAITLVAISEFARSMTSNGAGTDHGWGGNYFVVGGDVDGGKVHGAFPDLRVDGEQSISSTGHMLPTLPWEALWKPIVQWYGVQDAQLATVLPNVGNFGSKHLLEAQDVFKSSSTTASD